MSVCAGLAGKGIAFEVRTVDPDTRAQHAPDCAAQLLMRLVPTLVDGGFRLSEVRAASRYRGASWRSALTSNASAGDDWCRLA